MMLFQAAQFERPGILFCYRSLLNKDSKKVGQVSMVSNIYLNILQSFVNLFKDDF